MQRILYAILATLLFAGTSCAATFQGEQLHACGRSYNISPDLQPTALFISSTAELEAKNFALVYKQYAQRFESTLLANKTNDPVTAKFIARILSISSEEEKYFDVTHEPDLKAEVFFAGSDNNREIIVECSKIPPYFADMAAVSLMTRWVRSQELLGPAESRSRFTIQQYIAHEALLYNGLPMWPWELWLNGKRLGKSDWEALFKTQWVFLRPVAGIEINTRDRASANLDIGVGIEPLGFVHYQNDEYKSWWGASLLVTSSTNAGIGVGGLLRWNSYVLGVTRHESNTAGIPDSNFVFIGVELFDLLNKKRDDFNEWKQLQKNRVSEVLDQSP